MLCELSSPVTEANDGGLKCLVGLMVKCSFLEILINNKVGSMLSAGLLLSSGHHLALLSWLYNLACWHLCFWKS